MSVTREMETLLLHTVDPGRPGIAFRCEKGRLYVLPAVRPVDLEKVLREGGILEITVKGWDTVTVEMPESDDALFDHYIESCNLDPDFDPNAGT